MKKLYYSLVRGALKSVGRLSTGIDMSYRYGLVSGKMLDYVYQNKPQGRLGIGRWFDALYLNSPGWKSIREREALMEAALRKTLDQVSNPSHSAHILDIAAGKARYVIEVLAQAPYRQASALLRDLDERWVHEGNAILKERSLNHLHFETGDAFDQAFFASAQGQYNVIVSSGFYDWLTDDAQVKQSFKLVVEALPSGGYFLFTNQCGHFNLEFMENVFTDLNQNALKMVVRNVDTMNGWAQDLGMKIVSTKKDSYGYYAVTIAQKI